MIRPDADQGEAHGERSDPVRRRTGEECLRIAACLEEHFPHSMAKAVVDAAKKRRLAHEEMHSKVEYVVAHGISSYIDGKKVVIGSSHFVLKTKAAQSAGIPGAI